MKKVQVIASGVGFDGYLLRKPGETFEVSEKLAKKYSSWFAPVDPKFVVAPRVEPRPQATVNAEIDDLKRQVARLTASLTAVSEKAGGEADEEGAGGAKSLV